MPRQTRQKIDKEEIIRLIQKGKKVIDISRKLKCHHSSIYYWLEKYGLKPPPPSKKAPKPKVFKKLENLPEGDTIFDDGINKGKNYEDYLSQEQAKKTDPIERARVYPKKGD